MLFNAIKNECNKAEPKFSIPDKHYMDNKRSRKSSVKFTSWPLQ